MQKKTVNKITKIFAVIAAIVYVMSIFSGIAFAAVPESTLVTERFGGTAATLDHANVMKCAWFGFYAGSGHLTSKVIYGGNPFETENNLTRRNAVYIDVSAIPAGTRVVNAEYVMPYDMKIYPFSANRLIDGLSMYKIIDPSGTGMWNENNLGTRTKNGDLNIPWAEGKTFADCVDPNPIATIYGIAKGSQMFYFFDMTSVVQEWVDNSAANMGVTFDGSVPSDVQDDPHFRPYLQITYQVQHTNHQSQPTNINAFHRAGQTFVTWTELPYEGQFYDMLYRVYRHTQPVNAENLADAEMIAEVNQLSGYNARRSEVRKEDHNYKINPNGSEISDDTGLFVYTTKVNGNFYYAVTSVMEGNENINDFNEQNSIQMPVPESVDLPVAICQAVVNDNGKLVQEFVHWATDRMSYKVGHGFNFMINVSPEYNSDTPAPIEIMLGGRSTTYYNSWASRNMVTIRPDDYLPPTRNFPYDGYQYDNLQTWWSGCRNNYKTQTKRSDGIFIPYTENRILYTIAFVKKYYNIDNDRVYVRGGSMGGTGAMSFGLKYPDVVASVHAVVGCPNWRFNFHEVDENYQVTREGWRNEGKILWGDFDDTVLHENGTPMWDWMNAGWYAKNHKELPFLAMDNGKLDGSIVFFPMPGFYKDMKDSRHGFCARFYDGGHSGYLSPFATHFGSIVKDESFPAFQNMRIDNDPGDIHEPTGMALLNSFSPRIFSGDSSGEINGYRSIQWARELYQFDSSDIDDMVDQADRYEITLRVENNCDADTVITDITPRRLQHFVITQGFPYYWENKRLTSGAIIQNGIVTGDNESLLTIKNFIIEKSNAGNKLIVTPADTQVNYPPSFEIVSDIEISKVENIQFTVHANDPNGDELSYSANGLPSGASFNPGNQIFTWMPSADQGGVYHIGFHVSDGSFSDEITVRITADFGAPVITILHPETIQTADASIHMDGSLSDDVGVVKIDYHVLYPDGTHYYGEGLINGQSWYIDGLYLQTGRNIITVSAHDASGKTGESNMAILRTESEMNEITVSTVDSLRSAIQNLQSNTTILLEDGIYDIPVTLVVGQAWAANSPLDNIVIRSKSGNRDAVVIRGPGMTVSGNANNVFLVRHVIDFTIMDLSIRDSYWHLIQLQGEQGANRPHLKNLHLIDAGEQFIKVTRDAENKRFCNHGILENSLIEFTDHARFHPYMNTYYTDGIDVLGGDSWIIRDNIFKNIRSPQDSTMIAGAAILMWHNSKNTIIERNAFIECDLGIHLGNPSGVVDDHVGGIIRNNFFFRAGKGDTGISLNKARNAKVYNNTIILNNTFPWTIEYRYATYNGDICGDIRYNLTDGPILRRDGGTANLESNITDAESDWFVDIANGDLHLSANATDAINKVPYIDDVADDFDAHARPFGTLADIGADEYESTQPENLIITTDNLMDGIENSVYFQIIAVNGGIGPFTFSIENGKLPEGLSLNALSGAISGMPVIEGNYMFTIQVQDHSGQTISKGFTIFVQPEPDTEPPTVPQNLTARPISQTQIELTWEVSTDNNDTITYHIYRNNELLATVSETTYVDNTVEPGNTYTYAIVAVDFAGNASESTEQIFVDALAPMVKKIYRSVGPGAFDAIAVGNDNPLNIVNSIATFVISLPDNVGVGDAIQYDSDHDDIVDSIAFIQERVSSKQYVLQQADSVSALPVSDNITWSIYRAYTSLYNAEAGIENESIQADLRNFDSWTDGRDLVANNEQWHIACYADADDTSFVTIAGWITDDTHFIRIFTPVESNEAGQSQRHTGAVDNKGYQLFPTSPGKPYSFIQIEVPYTVIDGLKIKAFENIRYSAAIDLKKANASRIMNNLIYNWGNKNAYSAIKCRGGNETAEGAYIVNNIVIGSGIYQSRTYYGIRALSYYDDIYVLNNTVYNIQSENGGGIAMGGDSDYHRRGFLHNNISWNNTLDFVVTDYIKQSESNFSKDDSAPGTNSIWGDTQAKTVGFVSTHPGIEDLHIRVISDAIDAGSDLRPSVITDMDGEIRNVFDMGADEYKSEQSDLNAPTTPANLFAKPLPTFEIELSWQGSEDNVQVAGYEIFRNGIVVGTSNKSSFLDTGLEDLSYDYQVRAFDHEGNVSDFSNLIAADFNGPFATPIYRSVGYGSISPLAQGLSNYFRLSDGLATFAYPLPVNIGVGDVIQYDSDNDGIIDAVAFIHSRISASQYMVKTADAGVPESVYNNLSWSIYRAYTSLRNAEAGLENEGIDANVRNFDAWDVNGGKDLVSAEEFYNFACYADAVDRSYVTIDGWNTGEHNYVRIFAPSKPSEVGISQRHDGTIAGMGFELCPDSPRKPYSFIQIEDPYTVIDGIKIKAENNIYYSAAIYLKKANGSVIQNNFIYNWGNRTAYSAIKCHGGNETCEGAYIRDNIIYGSNDSQTRTYYGIKATSYYDDVYVLNNSVYNILSAGGGIAMGGDSDYHRRGYLIGNLCEGNSENFVLTAFIKEVRDNISR
jgi:chitodextrinase/pimeloyl-ACP methyl ester carboxylesterase